MSVPMADKTIALKGFRVEIKAADGSSEPDSAWETCTGGALSIEVADSSTGGDQRAVAAPGAGTDGPVPKSVTELRLRGPLTAGRKWIAQNLNDTLAGKDTRFDLTLVEIGKDGADGKRFTYHECFLTEYRFPTLSADATGGGTLYEVVTLKATRLTIR